MPNITVRKIPKEIYSRLRKSAKTHARSLNAEILAILTDDDGWALRRAEIQATLPELDRVRAELAKKYPNPPDSVELIREDRDSR
jgi:plasmid stability protein